MHRHIRGTEQEVLDKHMVAPLYRSRKMNGRRQAAAAPGHSPFLGL